VREILYGRDGNGIEVKNLCGRVGEVNERDVIWDEDEITKHLGKIKGLAREMREHEKAGD
jgi:hypothetical protein